MTIMVDIYHREKFAVLRVVSLHPYCHPSNSWKRSFNSGCSSIASAAHITQVQLNPVLNCTTIPIGTGVCLRPPCSKPSLVAPGDWCTKIESSQGVSEAHTKTKVDSVLGLEDFAVCIRTCCLALE